jgi:hypothetical protein
MQRTSACSAPPSPVEEGEITDIPTSSGVAWNHSRWGHLV